MNDVLQKFVASHPDFFEKTGDCYVLRSDIHDLVEQYARLVDADEYERVRKLVDSFRKDSQQHLESEIRENKEAMQSFKSQIPEIVSLIDQSEDELSKLERKIRELELKASDQPKGGVPWYYSGVVFWLLAVVGIACMYVGIFITVSGASSFLPLGLFFLIGGVVLQSRETSPHRAEGPRLRIIQLECEQLKSKARLLKIKRATYLQQKSVAKQAMEKLQMSIRNDEQKKEFLNG